MQKRDVVPNRLLVARGHATIVLDPIEKTLDKIAFFVEVDVIVAGFFAPFAARNDRLRLQSDNRIDKGLAVVALVGQDCFKLGTLLRCERTLAEQGLSLRDVMALTRCHAESKRIAQGIGYNMDFA